MNAIVRIVLLLDLLCAAATAPAQIGLPPLPTAQLPLPLQAPVPPVPVPSPAPVLRDLGGVAQQAPVPSSVRKRARALLEHYPGQVERDPHGAPVVRVVVLALSPDEQALRQALARGFRIQSDETPQPLGARIVTLLVPPGLSTQRALRRLRAADPGGSYDFDHLFTATQTGTGGGGVDADHEAFATR
jgi:hypothetical protein